MINYLFSLRGIQKILALNDFGQLDTRLRIPDIWQQEALALLLKGDDVIVHAPTGAGKTFLVELLAAKKMHRQIIHSVPTRALANDKAREWMEKGMRVGLVTGDISLNPEAPLVVATLETHKSRFLRGQGPGLFVVDEYQMLGDEHRGVNYELVIASAPRGTQLLMLSGSVSNPRDVVEWLQRIGRRVSMVSVKERPVPLEEVFIDSLPGNVPRTVKGFWPRYIAKALMADLGPVLMFSPQRKGTEKIAKQLSVAVPVMDTLVLSPVQKRLAGPELARLLKNRVAYHHSGLSYQQRAGLIEPLAKAGQLRVVVSTTGLASGVNFSMRSVVVTEGDYTAEYAQQVLRPDELLQMFGRAGRRGLDERGYALVVPGKPRLGEARPCPVKRPGILDWPSLIGAMSIVADEGGDPFTQAVSLGKRLFQGENSALGVEHALEVKAVACGLKIDLLRAQHAQPSHSEMRNSVGRWEALCEQTPVALGRVRLMVDGVWVPFLESAQVVRRYRRGALHKFSRDGVVSFGKRVVIAYSDRRVEGRWRLSAWFWKSWNVLVETPVDRVVDDTVLRAFDRGLLSRAIGYGEVVDFLSDTRRMMIVLDIRDDRMDAHVDSEGLGLLEPKIRKTYAFECSSCPEHHVCENTLSQRRSTVSDWLRLGLIDRDGIPTRRGRVFSFFQNGEGLAIAAALEEASYSVDLIAHDLANLRAGFRFDESGNYSHRLGRACRSAYGDRSYDGYLKHGLPPHYGEGAAEVIAAFSLGGGKAKALMSDVLKPGDVERVRLEWLSLLRQVRAAPELEWPRWEELKCAVSEVLAREEVLVRFDNLPDLEPAQQGRVNHQLRFPRGY